MSSTLTEPVVVAPDRPRTAKVAVTLVVASAFLTVVPVVPDKLALLVVVCAAALPFVIERVWGACPGVRLVVVTAGVWLVGQLVSDAVVGSGLHASMQVATAGAVLVVVPVLVARSRGDVATLRLLVAGVMLGLALVILLVEHAPVGDPRSWKFGLNDPVAVVLLALADLAWLRGRRTPSVVALAVVATMGIATDHRHLVAVSLLTGVAVLAGRRDRVRSTAAVGLAAVLVCVVAAGGFIGASRSGLLGSRSGDQITQFGERPVSILVNVRPEPFQELYLFSRRPVLGWSSQPHLDSSSYDGSKQFLASLGVVREDLDDIWLVKEEPGVSAHSQVADSMVRAGVAAAPFWILIIVLGLRAGVLAVRDRSSPLVVMWTALVVWDVVVSPLVSMSHVEIAAYLALVVAGTTPRSRDA